MALDANLDAGESLRHVIYSLTYDATEFEYQGLQLGSKASDWEYFDNPDEPGVTHGIVHLPPHAAALRESGEIIVFRFRARKPNAASRLGFTRSKANDLDVQVAGIEISNGGTVGTDAVPVRYTLRSQPNPFNPSTRILFTIPAGAGEVPVSLRVYDISGRLGTDARPGSIRARRAPSALERQVRRRPSVGYGSLRRAHPCGRVDGVREDHAGEMSRRDSVSGCGSLVWSMRITSRMRAT